jgi:methylase of polypeptide subunit release factors
MFSFRDAFLSSFFRGYYRYTALLNRLVPAAKVDGRAFTVFPSVCRPLGNEQVVAEYVPPGKNVLEIGCGSGIITLYAAQKSRHVTAVDVSPEAVQNTKINLAAQRLENVSVARSDGFQEVRGTFDVVISNPPWVNFELADPTRKWASSATLIPRLFRESGRFLTDDGLLVISCPAAAEERLVGLARECGFSLLATYPREKRKDFRIRVLTLLYLQVGFHPLVYVFRKEGTAA